MNRRAYTYDCHGWIEGITTSIPAFVVSVPELHGSVSNDFYRSATTGIGTADTFEPTPVTEDYTERIMYATGSHPRYDGTASAHVATAGGRYDYLFDCHDRLIKAAYSAADGVSALGGDVDYTENFSTEYTYNPVGVPLTVKRYGVQRIDNSSGSATEQFGILDNLSYSYDGMLLSSVLAYGSADGEDYYGRPGFPTSYEGGPAEYGWNAAGLLDKDSARGITGISYNWNGQPTTINFTDKGYMSYTYTAAGTLTGVATYAVLGGKRATKVRERRYCGDFVFEGDSLLYANFGGGYFDGDGQPHYRHADFQGNISMVTNAAGQIEQHTGYYPYGEPWREPTGQPYLYGGKERMRDHALNEYDFGPRRLSSALCLWTAPDPLASDYAPLSPYSYCAGNPIKFVDPSGKNIYSLSSDGSLHLTERTDDDYDTIKGKDGDYITVSKSFMGKAEYYAYDHVRAGKMAVWRTDIHPVEGDGDTEFTFLAENSDVEWTKISSEKGGTFVGTSHNDDADGSADLIQKHHPDGQGNTTNFDHAHPTEDTASKADIYVIKNIEKHSPNVKCRIYHPKTKKWETINSKTIGIDLSQTQSLPEVIVEEKQGSQPQKRN